MAFVGSVAGGLVVAKSKAEAGIQSCAARRANGALGLERVADVVVAGRRAVRRGDTTRLTSRRVGGERHRRVRHAGRIVCSASGSEQEGTDTDTETDENGLLNIKYYRPEQGGENFSRYQFYPQNALLMASRNFVSELEAIAGEIGQVFRSLLGKTDQGSLPQALKLSVSNDEVNSREKYREEVLNEKPEVWPPVRSLYDVLCKLLDFWFDDSKPIQRFWFLETVARVPYFSYVSILHLYETLGWWRDAKLIQLHSLEAANEFVHLLIMESLGGNRSWKDRFFAEHLAILYYWSIVVLFLISPKQSYAFSQLLEAHATDTYSVFLEQNEERLKTLPAPLCAVNYYNDPDSTVTQTIERRMFPKFNFSDFVKVAKPVDTTLADESTDYVRSLYDVFRNIAKDEQNHVEAMVACQGLSKGMFDGFDPESNTIMVSPTNTKQKRTEKQRFIHSKRSGSDDDLDAVSGAVNEKVGSTSSNKTNSDDQ